MYQRANAPRSIGGVLDSTFSLWLATLGLVWVYALIPRLVIAVLNSLNVLAGGSPGGMTGGMTGGSLTLSLLIMVAAFASIGFYSAAIVRMHDRANGGSMSFGQALSQGFHLFWRMLLSALLMGLMIVPVGAIAAILLPAVRKTPSFTLILFPLMALFVVALLYVFVRISLAWVFAIVEDKSATASIAASWAITRGNWWRCAAIFTVVSIVAYVFLIILGMLVGLFGFRHGVANFRITPGWVIATQFIGVIFSLLSTPLFSSLVLSLYYDLKLRREGADLVGRVDAMAASGG